MTDSIDEFLFQIGPLHLLVGFVIVMSTFLLMAVKGLATWSGNNTKPRLLEDAKVISKRTGIRGDGKYGHGAFTL